VKCSIWHIKHLTLWLVLMLFTEFTDILRVVTALASSEKGFAH
jgi:hypothetical protein